MRSPRTGGPMLTIFFFLLSFAVFGWGLHYKLSLYNTSATSSPTGIAAKLLSQQERATSPEQQISHAKPVITPRLSFLAILFIAVPSPVLVATVVRTSALLPSRAVLCAETLFTRPPPFVFSRL
jgi:hypothetical protein